MKKNRYIHIFVSILSWFLFVSCSKKETNPNPSIPVPWSNHYKSFREDIDELEYLDTKKEDRFSQLKTTQTLHGLFANLSTTTKGERELFKRGSGLFKNASLNFFSNIQSLVR